MATQNPWFKFYPSLWAGDLQLRRCSQAARGLWIDCLCIMHEANPRGYLLINGAPPTTSDLAAICGRTSPEEVETLLNELRDKGVIRVDRAGKMYSKRMINDTKKRDNGKKYGKMGGNPTLTKQKENSNSDNPQLNLGVNGDLWAIEDKKSQKSQKNQNQYIDITDWNVGQANAEKYAQQFNIPLTQIAAERDKFKNHALANGRKIKNADAAFRNWLSGGLEKGWITPQPPDKPKPSPDSHPGAYIVTPGAGGMELTNTWPIPVPHWVSPYRGPDGKGGAYRVFIQADLDSYGMTHQDALLQEHRANDREGYDAGKYDHLKPQPDEFGF